MTATTNGQPHCAVLPKMELGVAPKKPSSWEGRRKYQRAKLVKQLLGQAVRLTREVTTRGGKKYAKGSLWRVAPYSRRDLSLDGILPDGTSEPGDRGLIKMDPSDVALDASIPPAPRAKTLEPEPVEEEDEDEQDDE